MNDKIVVAIIAALGGGIFTVVSTYLTGRIKIRQLEFERMLRHSNARLAAAHEKLSVVYTPIMSCVEECYHAWYILSSEFSDSNKKAFISTIDNLKREYLKLIKEGLSIYILPQAHEELERLVRFLDKSQNASTVNYLIVSRMEGIGMRSVVEKEYNRYLALPVYCIMIFPTVLSRYVRYFGTVINTSVALRVHSAPIDSQDFASEFKVMIDVLRSSVNEVALFQSSLMGAPAGSTLEIGQS
jgi:hypothetical protein